MKPSLLLVFIFFFVAGSVFAQKPADSPSQPAQAQATPHTPHAKTQAEFNDFKTAAATTGGAAMEAAADSFVAKYPESELRAQLYMRAMHEYQNENNPVKGLAMAEKVLTLDPENSVALVLTATMLSDQLSESKPDQEQVAEVKKNGNLALQTIDTAFVPPGPVTPEQLIGYKNMLKGMAHSALGVADLKTGDNAAAELELKAATDLNKAQPDPYVWYQLAVSQERQKKYADALTSANQGLQYAGSDARIQRLLGDERDKVKPLAGK